MKTKMKLPTRCIGLKMNRFFSSCILACTSVFLLSCSTAGNVIEKTWQVWSDPSIRVGDLNDQPSTFSLSIIADKDINPNPYSIEEIGGAAETDGNGENTLYNELYGDTNDHIYTEEVDETDSAPVVEEETVVEESLVEETDSEEATSAVEEESTFKVYVDENDQRHIILPGQSLPENAEQSASAQALYEKYHDKDYGGRYEDEQESASNQEENAAVSQPEPIRRTDQPSRQESERRITRQTQLEDEATPLKIRIFQLSDDSLFKSLSYDELFLDAEDALGKTYIYSQDYVIEPGQFKFVEPEAMEEKTHYIAIVAFYNNYYDATWKGSVKIRPTGEFYPLVIKLARQQALIGKEN